MDVAFRAGNAEAVRAHNLEVRTAGEEGDVGARSRETSAEVAADAAAADDRNAHRTIVAHAKELQAVLSRCSEADTRRVHGVNSTLMCLAPHSRRRKHRCRSVQTDE